MITYNTIQILKFSSQVIALEKRPSEFPNDRGLFILVALLAIVSEIPLALYSKTPFLTYMFPMVLTVFWVYANLLQKKMTTRIPQSVCTLLGIMTVGNLIAGFIALLTFLLINQVSAVPLLIAIAFKLMAAHRIHRFSLNLRPFPTLIRTALFAFLLMQSLHITTAIEKSFNFLK